MKEKKKITLELPYFCTCCGASVAQINQAFVIDDKSSRYFCSESCIVDFHKGYVNYFEDQEKKWRKNLKILDEKVLLSTKEKQHWLDQVLITPDEMWLVEDALGLEYYCLIKRCGMSVDSAYLVLVCHMFHLKPSFVLHQFFTKETKLLDYYRWGKSFSQSQAASKEQSREEISKNISRENSDNSAALGEEVILSKELLQEIELLRSQLLSELILMRSDSDIPLEGFSAYEKYMEKTIDQPDESFEFKTKDGQQLLVNISDQLEKSKSLFYFVVSMKLSPEVMLQHTQGRFLEKNGKRPMIIPVLAFPSIDVHIYQHYKKGNCINKRSLN